MYHSRHGQNRALDFEQICETWMKDLLGNLFEVGQLILGPLDGMFRTVNGHVILLKHCQSVRSEVNRFCYG